MLNVFLIYISLIICSKNDYVAEVELPGYTSYTVSEQVCFIQNITNFSCKVNNSDCFDLNDPTDVYIRYEPEIQLNMTCKDIIKGQISFLGNKTSFRMTPVTNSESNGVMELKTSEDIIITYVMTDHSVVSFETKLNTVYTRIDQNLSEF